MPPVLDSERIDFTVLTDELRILPTSRSWSGVQESIRTLQSRPSAEWRQPGMQDHTQNVEVFAETIREHADLIAYSFACAAALAHVASPSARDTSIHRALQTLSSALNFRALSAKDVHERLRMVWTVLRSYERGTDAASIQSAASDHARMSYEPLPDGGSPKVQTANDVEPYFVWLENVLAGVRTAPAPPGAVMARIQSEAWLSVRARYEDVARNLPERAPAVAEVICRIAQLLPSAVLAFSIAETPAAAWADLIAPGAVALPTAGIPIPWWAHGLAAHALGFRSPDVSATRDLFSFLSARSWSAPPIVKSAADPVREWEDFFRSSTYLTSKRSLPQAAYVIRRAQDSMVAHWTTCPTVATLPVTTGQVNALVANDASMSATLGSVLWRTSEECVVALEYPLDSPDHAAAASALLKHLAAARGSEANIRRISFGPSEQRPNLPFGGLYLESVPQRYEDLVPRAPS